MELRGPKGLRVAIQTDAGWSETETLPLRVGLLPGLAYRLKIKEFLIDLQMNSIRLSGFYLRW